ncbi:MAG TPA: helix-hairpin-helix domain-containing protein [Sedimentisphaerales bacterium]|nr:helix-hairpin-helix domain-containing protein [Sedimentisphaerales bacterium]HQG49137.1 helix-hairpin-helix domain-containing protein [Sedimentisphaerales bacterium]HQI27712.1 helix-hairpin-helix domain-containing protein [Sedimentisphaerales bacterium]
MSGSRSGKDDEQSNRGRLIRIGQYGLAVCLSPDDRCMLYVLRYAVYYVSSNDPDPELLKWWSWKDRERETAE